MDEEKYNELMGVVDQVSWMTAILEGYCENFEEKVKEIYCLKELATLIRQTHKKIYSLF